MEYRDNIILLGPLATGKSSIATKISELTGLHNHPIDKLKWYYRHKNGYDLCKSTHILKTEGFESLLLYARQFFGLKDLKSILFTFKGIIDLGASDSYYVSDLRRDDFEKLMGKFNNVFLILPSADPEESIQILNDRLQARYENNTLKKPVIESYLKMNAAFIKCETSKKVAKYVIYTKGKTVEECAREIVGLLKYRNRLKKAV
ncbi:MAG: hypothetical protein ACWA41_11505 [Putridiphycobacter sp.]